MDFMNLSSELMSIVSDEYKLGIQEILNNADITNNAQLLLALCKIVTQKIDIYTAQVKAYGQVLTIYKGKTNLSKQMEDELMVYGAQLIYLIRSFVQDEEIMFHMATKDQDGKYKADAFIPQSQVLKNLSATKTNAIGVSIALQNQLISTNSVNTLSLKRENLWKRVEYLSEARYLPGKNIGKIDMRKAGEKKAHWAYQSQKKDMMIYLKFSGKQITKYYDTVGNGKRDGLQSFNNGWLWEWYNSVLYGGTEEQIDLVNTSIKQGSLKPIIFQKDYTPGTKQGDFQNLLGQQVQSKYNNEKIISYNNIRHILYKLDISLTQYIQEGQTLNASQNLLEVLQEHFFPESVRIGENYGNNKINELLNKFNANIK